MYCCSRRVTHLDVIGKPENALFQVHAVGIGSRDARGPNMCLARRLYVDIEAFRYKHTVTLVQIDLENITCEKRTCSSQLKVCVGRVFFHTKY